jgi:protein-tyrosine kinase
MSKIFDFLRKTEVGGKKMPPVQSPEEFDAPIADPMNPQPESEQIPVIQKPSSTEEEITAPDNLDLSHATNQLKTVLDPLTVVGEQFRVLRSRLSLMQKQKGIKTVLITSTLPGEGKSFTSSGLAGVFAQELNKRVVVIDADMRKPGSGRDFGLNGNSSNIGMAQVLQGEVEFQSVLQALKNPRFWFLSSGELPSNPSELLSSPNLERILKSAAENFDWVIVDSPPVLSLSDATLIAPLVDTVLLIIGANSTSSKLVAETINRIGRDRICGIVINRQKNIPSSRYYYHYYYRNTKK